MNPIFLNDSELFIIVYPIQAIFTYTYLIFIVITAIILLRRGIKNARYFLISFFIFIVFAIIYITMKLGLIPYMHIFDYNIQIGFLLQIILLALALGDKINIMREEKDIAQAEAIENQKLAVENLEKADKLKDDFLARTSHELRTPLNGIIGLTDSILDPKHGHKLSDTAKTNLAFISATTKRLYYLISDITDYSRLKYSTKIKLHRKAINLRSITTLVLAICKPLVISKSIELINDVSDEISPVSADEDRLQQILYNLIGNAVKYTDKGYIKVSALEPENKDYIEISVTDTGVGIDRDKQHKIFNSYEHYDKNNRNTQGLGLGLNITKLLVETHGGSIHVEYGEDGKGTTFVFTLLKADKIDEPINELKAQRQAKFYNIISENIVNLKPVKKVDAKARILIADDDGANVQFLVDLLQDKGYDMDIAFDGEEALSKIRNDANEFDLILLDLLMPKVSGYDVCKVIRKNHSMTKLPIIILTAKDHDSSVTTCFERGANDYLMKPCNKDELLVRIETLLKLKRYNDKLYKLNLDLEKKVKERTEELEQNLIELRNANNELSVFSYILAHDLTSPISVIDGHLQALMGSDYAHLDDETKWHIQNIYETEQDMLDTFNALLKLSQLKGQKLEYERVDLSRLAIDSFSRQKKLDKDRDKVKIHIDNNVIAYGDRYLLKSLVGNLISNAWKFTKEVSNPEITFGQIQKDNETIYYIKDNGIGFEMEHKEEIFEVFKRVNKKKNVYKGFGIGLSIVKRVIEKHHGDIWTESEPKKGTAFYFKLGREI